MKLTSSKIAILITALNVELDSVLNLQRRMGPETMTNSVKNINEMLEELDYLQEEFMKKDRWKEKAITALNGSIEHWKAIVDDVAGHYPAAKQCACCQEWFDHGCFDCPVSIRSGAASCINTPYDDAHDAFYCRETGKACDQHDEEAMVEMLYYLEETLQLVKQDKVTLK